MVFGSIGSIIGAGSGLLGGIAGYRDSNNAAKAQKGYITQAIDAQHDARGAINAGVGAARPFYEDILGVAQSLEDDLLGQIDSVTAGEMRRIRQERAASEAQVQQQMAASGLDSFTTAQGAQSSVRGAGSNAMADLAARVASQRSGAITTGRGAEMNALGGLGNLEMQAGQARAGTHSAISQILSGVQVQAPNTAAGIGALGNSLMEGYRTSVLDQALSGAGPGGGGGSNVWSGAGSQIFAPNMRNLWGL